MNKELRKYFSYLGKLSVEKQKEKLGAEGFKEWRSKSSKKGWITKRKMKKESGDKK